MSPFSSLMLVAMVAVLAVLVLGVISMARGGDFNRKHANLLMRWRIGLQAVALVFFVLALLGAKI